MLYCLSVFVPCFFQEMEGQSQGTKGHAALALEAIFQKTVAHKNFYQPFWEMYYAREGSVPDFLLQLECLALLPAPSSGQIDRTG